MTTPVIVFEQRELVLSKFLRVVSVQAVVFRFGPEHQIISHGVYQMSFVKSFVAKSAFCDLLKTSSDLEIKQYDRVVVFLSTSEMIQG